MQQHLPLSDSLIALSGRAVRAKFIFVEALYIKLGNFASYSTENDMSLYSCKSELHRG